MKIIGEFKKFISRGNVMDMAVGVVMGTAFTKIVSSLVTNIITPIISLVTGRVNVASLSLKINDELSITYGEFLQSIIDFLLIAVAVFFMVKLVNRFKDAFVKAEEETPPSEPELSDEAKLLLEIRDLLKDK